MTGTINEVQTVLAGKLETLLVTSDCLQSLKAYPTIVTDGLSPIGMLASMGTTAEGGTVQTGSQNNDREAYDFALIIAAKCEKGNDATWQTGEELLNTAESRLKSELRNLTSAYWTKIIYRQPSTRPPAPPEFPFWRWAEIYLRVLLH